MDKLEEEIVGRIKEMMDRRGVNQSELAKELGLHQYDVSRMLNGKPFPSISELKVIANYLDSDMYYLIGVEEESHRELTPAARKVASQYITADPTVKVIVDRILETDKLV